MLKPMLARRTLLAWPATAAGGIILGLRRGRAASAAQPANGKPWIWPSGPPPGCPCENPSPKPRLGNVSWISGEGNPKPEVG